MATEGSGGAQPPVEEQAKEEEKEEQPRPSSRELLRLLWPYVKPDAALLSVGFGALFLASYSNSMTPRLLRAVIDGTKTDGSGSATARQNMVKAAAVFTAGSIGSCVRTRCFGVASANIARRLQAAAFSSMLTREQAFFDTEKTAACVDALVSDVSTCTLAITKTAGNLLRYTSSVCTGSFMIFQISGRLLLEFAGMAFTLVPFVAGTSMWQYKKLKRARVGQDEGRVMIQGFATERLAAIKTVKAFSRESHEASTFDAIASAAAAENKTVARAEGFMFGWLDWSVKTAGLGLVAYGSELVRRGVLSAGNLASFTMYSGLAGMGLSGFWGVYTSDWQSPTWRALRYIHGAGESSVKPVKAVAAGKLTGDVRFEGVSFAYPTRMGSPVLRDVSFALRPGQVLALTGPSGCGKSTVAALLLRLYEENSGRVLFDGVPAKDLDVDALRAQIGVVEQDAMLFSGTLRENIRYGRLDATDAEVQAAAQIAHAHEFISEMPDGYDTIVGERGLQLSGGQRQRVAIARAVVKEPALLLLDEPTSALDHESEAIVHEALLQASQGRTVLIIAHSESTMRLAREVAVMGRSDAAAAGFTVLRVIDAAEWKPECQQ